MSLIRFYYLVMQRHQVRYDFGLKGLQLKHPPPYTTCVQHLPSGAWLLPSVTGDWLCASFYKPQAPVSI